MTCTFVPTDRLRTSFSGLRGQRSHLRPSLEPLPLRVAEAEGGNYEVLDGFKRLGRWKAEGRTEVPVVVEPVCGVVRKVWILESNCPERTLSPMDEARVVASLVDEDGLTPTAVGKLLGRKKTWVSRRLLLSRRLAPELAQRLDQRGLGLTVACGLCGFDRSAQLRLYQAVLRHGLRTREAVAFLDTYRAMVDAPSREALLRDPRSAEPRALDQGASPLGPAASRIAAAFDTLENSFREVEAADLSALRETERRVLEARKRQAEKTILKLALQLKETADGPRSEETHGGALGPGHVDPRHGQEVWPECEDGPTCPGSITSPAIEAEAGALRAQGARACGAGVAWAAHPAGAVLPGLHRLPDHTPRLPPAKARSP